MLTNFLPHSMTTINVALAVIYYQDKYLLGFRHQDQHQGNKYEFIGGKIDADETATEALIREVGEEVGMDIRGNVLVKLGRLHHHYGDKEVCLQVYKVALTDSQFAEYQHQRHGLEGQALVWANQEELLSGVYPLPAANSTILSWLQLPTRISITYPLTHFIEQSDASAAWLSYHQQQLPEQAWVYIRSKANVRDGSEQLLIQQLQRLRPDIQCIIPHHDKSPVKPNTSVQAYHLTQTELMYKSHQAYPIDRPLVISCHDAASIEAANRLAASRLLNQQPPAIGVFLSPVLVTQTHPNEQPLGWEAWSGLAQLADIPVIALGGLSSTMYQHATHYGATSIAGIRQFMNS